MSETKKKINLHIAGNSYMVDLDTHMATFIEEDLSRLGFNFNGDNKIEKLLKAYLQQVKERLETEKALDSMISTFREPEEA
jgi:hypothetical protein